ncbi:MAG: pyridoxamine 5'-phosphate oxidase family protein [Bacilli bacterium]
MSNAVESTLNEKLFAKLQKEPFVIVSTVDFESGQVNSNAISWVVAVDETHIKCAVDAKSRILENITANGKATFCVWADETVFSVVVDATVSENVLQDVPLKLGVVHAKVKEVRNVLFYGAKIVQEVQYDKTYDKQAAERLDAQVLEALRKG